MNQKMPKLGIALAAYQPDQIIFLEQLESIQKQSFQDWVCLTTFDSALPSYLYEAPYAEIKKDTRFVFIQNEKTLGHKKNFEQALRLLLEKYPSLEFISFCDQDDRWYENKLEKTLQVFNENKEAACVHCDMHLLLENKLGKAELLMKEGAPVTGWAYEGKVVDQTSIFTFLSLNFVAGTAMMVRKNAIENYLDIPDSFQFHDHWYALASSLSGKVLPLQEALFAYRQHQDNVIGASAKVALLDVRKNMSRFQALALCKQRFLEARARAETVLKIRHFRLVKCVFISKFDLGLGFLLLFIMASLRGHLRHSRVMLSLFLGKILALKTVSQRP